MDFDSKLDDLFIDLPEPPIDKIGALASKSGKLLFLSGQYPYKEGGSIYKGRVGLELTLDAGMLAAKASLLQALGTLRGVLGGSLNTIKRIVHLRLYIATGLEFKDHEKLLKSILDTLKNIFGSSADCSSEVIGCASLPKGASCELSMVVELKE